MAVDKAGRVIAAELGAALVEDATNRPSGMRCPRPAVKYLRLCVQYLVGMKDVENFQLNLRRLLFFHHASAREAARALDVSEHAVSAWLTGKRRPSLDALVKITETYDIDSRALFGDPYDFALLLGVRKRIQAAEAVLGPIGPFFEPAPVEQSQEQEDRARVEKAAGKPKAKAPAKRPASR